MFIITGIQAAIQGARRALSRLCGRGGVAARENYLDSLDVNIRYGYKFEGGDPDYLQGTFLDPEFLNLGIQLNFSNAADASSDFFDESQYIHSPTAVGNAQIDTAQFKFGTASLLLDGTGDFTRLPDPSGFNFSNNEWTVEFHIRFDGDPGTASMALTSKYDPADKEWLFELNNNVLEGTFSTDGSADIAMFSEAWNPVGDTWYHLAFCRDNSGGSDVVRVFVDGVQLGSDNTSVNGTTFNSSDGQWRIGAGGNSGDIIVACWIDNYRVTNGSTRYTTNFTPPTEAFPSPGARKLSNNGGILPTFSQPKLSFSSEDSIKFAHGVDEFIGPGTYPNFGTANYAFELWYQQEDYNQPGITQFSGGTTIIPMIGSTINSTRYVGRIITSIANGQEIAAWPTAARTGAAGWESFVDTYGDDTPHQLMEIHQIASRADYIVVLDGIPIAAGDSPDCALIPWDSGNDFALNGAASLPDAQRPGTQFGSFTFYDNSEEFTLQKVRELFELSALDGHDMLTVPKWVELDAENVTVKPFVLNRVTMGDVLDSTGIRSGAIPRHNAGDAINIYFELEIIDAGDPVPAGVEFSALDDERITDSQLTSSTDFSVSDAARHARLNNPSNSWTPSSQNTSQWWKIDFGEIVEVGSISTQGRTTHWVETYELEYNDDDSGTWISYNSNEVLDGNTDATSIVTNVLIPFTARFLRFRPKTWVSTFIMLRAEFGILEGANLMGLRKLAEGGDVGDFPDSYDDAIYINDGKLYNGSGIKLGEGEVVGVELGTILDAQMTANSSIGTRLPEEGRLNNSTNAWIQDSPYDVNDWIQIDFLGVRTIGQVQTQGFPTFNEYTMTYELEYSLDGVVFTEYNNGEVLTGNVDNTSIVTNVLIPFDCRYVRLIPKTWTTSPSIRLEYIDADVQDSSTLAKAKNGQIYQFAIAWTECEPSAMWVGDGTQWKGNANGGADPSTLTDGLDFMDTNFNWAAWIRTNGTSGNGAVRLRSKLGEMVYTPPTGFVAWANNFEAEASINGVNRRLLEIDRMGVQIEKEWLFEGLDTTEYRFDSNETTFFYPLTEGAGATSDRILGGIQISYASPDSVSWGRSSDNPYVSNSAILSVGDAMHTWELWYRQPDFSQNISMLLGGTGNTRIGVGKMDAAINAPCCRNNFNSTLVWESEVETYGDNKFHQLMEIHESAYDTDYFVTLDGMPIAEGTNSGWFSINNSGNKFNADLNLTTGAEASGGDFGSYHQYRGGVPPTLYEVRRLYEASALDGNDMLSFPQWCTLDSVNSTIDGTGDKDITLGDVTDDTGGRSYAIPRNGKVYFEVEVVAQGDGTIGNLGIRQFAEPDNVGDDAGITGTGVAFYMQDDSILQDAEVSVSTGTENGLGNQSTGTIFQVAIDWDTGDVWFGTDDTWNGNGGTDADGEPDTDSNPAFNIDTDHNWGVWAAVVGATGAQKYRLITASGDLNHTLPTDYSAWEDAD